MIKFWLLTSFKNHFILSLFWVSLYFYLWQCLLIRWENLDRHSFLIVKKNPPQHLWASSLLMQHETLFHIHQPACPHCHTQSVRQKNYNQSCSATQTKNKHTDCGLRCTEIHSFGGVTHPPRLGVFTSPSSWAAQPSSSLPLCLF